MKSFETIHRVPHIKKQLGAIHHGVPDLPAVFQQTLELLTSNCSSLFIDNPTIEWSDDMSSNTLAKTRTYFYKSNSVWKPNGHFKIYVNPSVNWWNGDCAHIPHGMYDIKSVLIHEVLHGIGFMSTIDVNKNAFPIPYDLLLQDRHHNHVVDGETYTGSFGQPLFIEGISIYNPSLFDSGSSFSHVDSEYRIMSSSIPHQMCRRTLDPDTAHVMYTLGHDCVHGDHTNTGMDWFMDTNMYFYIAGGIVFILGIVVLTCCCKQNGRKPREFRRPLEEPLLKRTI